MADQQYTISEFAAKVGLSSYTLRYYEKEGLLAPHRSHNGRRYYTDQDVKWLVFILHLKGTGMSMSQLQDYVRWRSEGDATIPQRLALLQTVQRDAQARIRELQANLEVLGHKIDWYAGKEAATIDEDESFAAYLKRIGAIDERDGQDE